MSILQKYIFIFLAVCFLGIAGFGSRSKVVQLFLPGTQVGTVAPADSVIICKQCHHSEDDVRPVPIFNEWGGSMMAHSARDPIFYAALAVANKYGSSDSVGEFCIRCHTPMGWLAGHSSDFTGQSIAGTDFDGVQCDYCHRAADPLKADSTVPVSATPVPGYGNGMHAVQQSSVPRRGPYDTVFAAHPTKYDPFQESSEMCGVCHDISNPYYAQDAVHQAPHEYAPLERTYSEWLKSWYATQGDEGTCQSCHMAESGGYACMLDGVPYRKNLARHDLTGGNTFVPDILKDFWTGIDTPAIAAGKQRTVKTLQRAADLRVESRRSGDSVIATVRVTNLTGHKLPTGYPEGRRMWINIVGRNAGGDTVFQSGKYNADSAVLVRDNQLKVYEAIHGLTDSSASRFGVNAGSSFHFSLNDTIIFDNRIPPKGFLNSAFQDRHAEPVGVSYADSQYWDETQYILPSTVTEITASLYYQTISKEYIDFLRDENVGNSYDWNAWGDKLHNSWSARGKSQPVVMNTLTNMVTGVNEEGNQSLPSSLKLMQNYPNPFNPSTVISYQLPTRSFVRLQVFNVLGEKVADVVNEMQERGSHSVEFCGKDLSSGIYLYQLAVGNFVTSKKMLLLK